MTTAAAPHRPVPAPTEGSLVLGQPAVVVLIGILVSFALSWPRLREIWDRNTFFDTDDAMRLVQVRAWLDGQGWFDLVAHRLHPPAGLPMHWSRVVDVPVGGLIRLFEVVTTTDRAERLARIVFPMGLQVALVAVTVAVARLLCGARAAVPAMILIVLSGFMFEQFPPGRIDHHAPQIVLLMTMTGAMLSCLAPGRACHAAGAALCIAVSLAISLENLPFMAVIVAVLPLVWLAEPGRARAALLWFAGSLAVAVPALFAATVPPSHYALIVGDALSLGHLCGALAGAAGLALLAVATPRLATARLRAVVLAVVGGAVAALMVLAFPACLHDPYAGMDPLLKTLWLAHVAEAQPLLDAARTRPDTVLMLFCPLLLGAAGAGMAAWRMTGLARMRWLAVAALAAVGLLGTLWEVRVAASAQPVAALGGVWVVTAALAAAQRRGSALAATGAILTLLPFGTLGWAFVPSGGRETGASEAPAQNCLAAAALAPFATLPPGLVFAPIDDGSHLLVYSPHSVVAAPYHRNQDGNRTVIDGFMAPPTSAEAIVMASKARYLAVCPGEIDLQTLAAVAPAGLGAQLAAGAVPPWLIPLGLPNTPFLVFAVAPADTN